MKLVIKYLYLGLSLGCMAFVCICLLGYLTGGEAFLEPVIRDFPRTVLGVAIIGIACGSTSVVYRIERFPMGIKVLIHAVAGMGAFYAVSFFLGWFSFGSSQMTSFMLPFLVFFIFFGIIWMCFYLYGRQDARKINDRLRELESEEIRRKE